MISRFTALRRVPAALLASKIVILMLYAYRSFQRHNALNTIFRVCRLFQQYVADQYFKVESDLLQYLHQNLTALHAADYILLCEQHADSDIVESEFNANRFGPL